MCGQILLNHYPGRFVEYLDHHFDELWTHIIMRYYAEALHRSSHVGGNVYIAPVSIVCHFLFDGLDGKIVKTRAQEAPRTPIPSKIEIVTKAPPKKAKPKPKAKAKAKAPPIQPLPLPRLHTFEFLTTTTVDIGSILDVIGGNQQMQEAFMACLLQSSTNSNSYSNSNINNNTTNNSQVVGSQDAHSSAAAIVHQTPGGGGAGGRKGGGGGKRPPKGPGGGPPTDGGSGSKPGVKWAPVRPDLLVELSR
ncbi:unnamed protein product [Vitrella brassicaformis CCMP3155]|uniref:Uncharacterized protein n=1 Tax=Vitrella brassicaformis (strain CCMP3155) TaxID=1169540 RepID=A0A0G4FGH1_VITBC|nr:unnamed protein product [Vitrella brassicaformis CCMP3155]|eukprot:CEM12398.1 unnamed protein product [Vitrella brassicaformis CCMP3155]